MKLNERNVWELEAESTCIEEEKCCNAGMRATCSSLRLLIDVCSIILDKRGVGNTSRASRIFGRLCGRLMLYNNIEANEIGTWCWVNVWLIN